MKKKIYKEDIAPVFFELYLEFFKTLNASYKNKKKNNLIAVKMIEHVGKFSEKYLWQ